jgi:outer membrane protein
VILQVRTAFYNATQASRLVTVNEGNLQNRQSHLALAQARLNSGLGLPIDVARAQTAVSEAVLSLTLAQNAATTATMTLAQAIGYDPRTPLRLADSQEPPRVVTDLPALTALALARRPELAQADDTVRAAQLAIAAARQNNAPSVVGTLGATDRGTGLSLGSRSLTLGVALQWSLVDGGLTSGKQQEAQAGLDSAAAQREQTRLSVIGDVAQSYLNLKTAEQRLFTATDEVTNAQESLRLAQGRYTAGLGVFLDVLDAQTALLTATTNQVNAQTALQQSRAALTHAIGQENNPAP